MNTIGFLAKKAISTFCYPIGLSLLLIFAGILLRSVGRKPRFGGLLVLSGALLLLVMSFPITGFLMVRSLEIQAGPYADPAALNKKGVRYIVVLAAEAVTSERTPADRMGPTLFRLMEGIRLWRKMPGAILAISGGSSPTLKSEPDAMAELPVSLGVPRESLVLETKAWDTEDEAKLFGKLVGKEPFALVTEAAHIPRAVRLFRDLGLNPIACPCHFRTKKWLAPSTWFLPKVYGLRLSQLAIHEYLGRLWTALKSRLRRP